MKTTSPIAAALSQLQLERENLAARLEKVDALIASMRDVFHLPTARAPRLNGHAVRPAPAGSNGHGVVSADAICEALRHGPMAPRDLAAALHVKASQVGYHVKKLAAQGVVRPSGTSNARRYALAERSAKEAP